MTAREPLTLFDTAPPAARCCEDCPAELHPRGRSRFCPSCRANRGRIQSRRAYEKQRAERPPIPALPCIDCGQLVQPSTGPNPGQTSPRCPECRVTHRRAVARAKWHGISVEEAKAAVRERRYYACDVCGGSTSHVNAKRCSDDCKQRYQRAYNRHWRYGTDMAEELARELSLGCRICGERPSTTNRDFCDACYSSGRRRVYRRALKQYGADHETAVLLSAAVRCAICDAELDRMAVEAVGGLYPSHIDHDHRDGHIRGVLCSACNKGLGLFCDDPVRMIAAADYLLGYRTVGLVDDAPQVVGLPASGVELMLRKAFDYLTGDWHPSTSQRAPRA